MAVRDWLSAWLQRGGDREGHPLMSDEAVASFVTTLPTDKPQIVLQYTCDAVEDGLEVGLPPERITRALMALDASAQRSIAALRRGMFRDARGENVSEAAVGALAQYYRRVAALYERSLQAAAPGEQDEAAKDALAALALCALRALAQRKKLAHFAYRAADPELWEAIARVMTHARKHATLRRPVQPYPSMPPTSVAQEHLVLLVFEMAPLGNLLPAHMEWLDLVLHHLAAGFQTGDEPGQRTPYFFDPARSLPPRRWREGTKVEGRPIFFGPGSAIEQLSALRKELGGAKEAPRWGRDGPSLEALRALIEVLAPQWGPPPRSRRHDRQTAEGALMRVLGGFEMVRRMVGNTEFVRAAQEAGDLPKGLTGTRLRLVDDTDAERGISELRRASTLELRVRAQDEPLQVLEHLEREAGRGVVLHAFVADTSDSGVGLSLAAGRVAWARPGWLAGYRGADSIDWMLGLVRRVERSPKGELRLGLERIPGRPSRARMAPSEDLTATPWSHELLRSGEGGIDCLLISGRVPTLVLPGTDYQADQLLTIWAEEQQIEVRIVSVIHQGSDFVLATFQQ